MEKFRLLRDHLVDQRPDRGPPNCCARSCAQPRSWPWPTDPGYIDRYMGGELSREDQRRLGLPWSEALARRTVRAVGGSLLAAEQALEHGLACHLAGGTHHAHYDYPAGFCIFNDLAVISRYLLASGRVQSRADLRLRRAPGRRHRTASSMTHRRPSPCRCTAKRTSPHARPRATGTSRCPWAWATRDYLKVVDDALNYLLPLYQPDLVLYDAGVDVHKDDALGYLKLTDARRRRPR